MIKLLLFVGNLCVSEASKVLVYVIGMVGQLHGLLLWHFLNEFPSFLVFSFECHYMKNVFLYPPQTKFWGYIVTLMSVRLSVRPSVRPSQSLIRYSSKTAEQIFMKFSGIVHYMMPYCTSYFKFLFEWFSGFPEQNKDFAITTYGGAGVSFCEHCLQYF